MRVLALRPPTRPFGFSTGSTRLTVWPFAGVALVVIGAMLLDLVLSGAGVGKALPYEPEADEPFFVDPAVHIAATGDLNPHWFGHPGATVIYPLAAALRIAYGGGLHAHVSGNPSDFYLIGRWLSIGYEVLSLPLVFIIGRGVFGTTAGLVATWIMAVLPIAMSHAEVIRTDSASVFIGLLAAWLCLRMRDVPSVRRVAVASIAVGVAIATRYFMVALVPLLLATILLGGWRYRATAHKQARWLTLGCLTVLMGFAMTSPFALLDPAELQKSLLAEAKSTTPGADGLSAGGNLLWYLTTALPADLTWPVACVAAIGILLALHSRRPERMLLAPYVVTYLAVISVPAQHWHRWIIEILPILALFSGYGLQALAEHLPAPRLAAVAMLGLIMVQPGYQLLTYDLQQVLPPPRIRARQWIMSNLPRGTRLAVEGYGPPLAGLGYSDTEMFTLAEPGGADDYAARGYRYLVVSSAVYDRYFAEPEKYPTQVAFYADLFDRGQLVAEFDSPVPARDLFVLIAGAECNCALHPTRGGPRIRVYTL